MEDEKEVQKLVNLLSSSKITTVEKALSILRSKHSGVVLTTEESPPPPPLEKSKKDVAEILATTSDDFKAKALKLFNVADQDHSGTIDESELHELLKEVLPGSITMAESNVIYHDIDTDHSGLITFDEFLAGIVKYNWNVSKLEGRIQTGYEWEIPSAEIELKSQLGKGAFGTVYKGKWRGIDIAAKKLELSPNAMEEFKKEIGILGKLRHPNVMLFMGACTEKANMYIVTEFLEGGSLETILEKRGNKGFDMKTTISWAKQTAFGLNYLHMSRIIHHDLKPENLLFDKNMNLKLCDFGLSTVKRQDLTAAKEKIGTPLWMAPEILAGKSYNEMVDVYAFALCVWQMLTGQCPYSDVESFDELKLKVSDQEVRPIIPSTCSPPLAQLIKACWSPVPSKRPNMAQIIAYLERISTS